MKYLGIVLFGLVWNMVFFAWNVYFAFDHAKKHDLFWLIFFFILTFAMSVLSYRQVGHVRKAIEYIKKDINASKEKKKN